jgi:hypothetical protein
MSTTIIRSTKMLKQRRSANVFILPQIGSSYYSTLDIEGDEIYWNQLSDEEFKSKMEKLRSRSASGLRTGTWP